jgi:hypothetical protein
MSPQLQTAIAAIQPLSPTDRQALMQILTQNDPENILADLKIHSDQFWQGTTIEQLRAVQNPMTVHDVKNLAADFWPEEDSVEDFLLFLRQQRQEVI